MNGLNELHQETPAEITPEIRDALRRVSPSTPFYIDITPLPGCSSMFCYGNVDYRIRREGGCREEGWIIYEGWGGRSLKLIHHCLWRSPDGRLVDVTLSDEVRNLFLPDSVHNQGEGVPARYIALDQTLEVAETSPSAKTRIDSVRSSFAALKGSGHVQCDSANPPRPSQSRDPIVRRSSAETIPAHAARARSSRSAACGRREGDAAQRE